MFSFRLLDGSDDEERRGRGLPRVEAGEEMNIG
jgi:hypothetical protein